MRNLSGSSLAGEHYITISESRLPKDAEKCFGRDHIINHIISLILNIGGRPIAIAGTPGIGKTTILTKVIHDRNVKNIFTTRRYYVSADAASTYFGLLECTAIAMGIPYDENLKEKIINLLKTNRSLIVFDNIDSILRRRTERAKVETLLREIQNIQNVFVILSIKSDTTLEDANIINIPPLDSQNMEKIFCHIAENENIANSYRLIP